MTLANVIMYSRSNKDFPGFAHMRSQILPILVQYYDWKRHESLYIDGELYKHGLMLQEVTSIARNVAKNSKPKKYPLEFWTFDCFYPSRTLTYDEDDNSMTFAARYALLEKIFTGPIKMKRYPFNLEKMLDSVEDIKRMINMEIRHNDNADDSDVEEIDVNYRGYKDVAEVDSMINLLRQYDSRFSGGEVPQNICDGVMKEMSMEAKRMGYFVLVPNTRVESFLQFEFYYQGLLSAEFEGAMFRNINGEYLTNLGSDDSRRSVDLQKHKPTYTREFPVIGFTTGKGTNAGAVIWICQAGSGKFNTVPKNSSIAERRSIYKELRKKKNFDKKYKGRLLTVEYEDISDDSTPLRAKGIGFRDID